jgi:hypothetical protein
MCYTAAISKGDISNVNKILVLIREAILRRQRVHFRNVPIENIIAISESVPGLLNKWSVIDDVIRQYSSKCQFTDNELTALRYFFSHITDIGNKLSIAIRCPILLKLIVDERKIPKDEVIKIFLPEDRFIVDLVNVYQSAKLTIGEDFALNLAEKSMINGLNNGMRNRRLDNGQMDIIDLFTKYISIIPLSTVAINKILTAMLKYAVGEARQWIIDHMRRM